jgi:excisionase family DNA binding protein
MSQVLFTFAQAAEMTALPESWLRKAVTERRIPFRKVGKHVRFSTADLDALVEQTAVPAAVSPLRRRATA